MFSSSLVPDSAGFSPSSPVLHFHLQAMCLGQTWSPARNKADPKKSPALSPAQLPGDPTAVDPTVLQPWETPPVPAPGAEAVGHHNQLSLYCHLLTETPSRNIWDCCFPQKSSSCHYSPAPAVLTNPKATDSATSWGHQSSLHPQGLCPHQLWLLLELVLQGEGGSAQPYLLLLLPSPVKSIYTSRFSKPDLVFALKWQKAFPQQCFGHCWMCPTALLQHTELKQDGCHEEEKVFTSGQGFSPKENHHKMSCCCSILQDPACRGEPEWALCNTEPHFSSLETF